jgi:hypothetical protein
MLLVLEVFKGPGVVAVAAMFAVFLGAAVVSGINLMKGKK